MNYIQFNIDAGEEGQEILISELSDLGADGFEQTESHLIAYFNEVGFRSYEVNQLLKQYNFTLATLEEKNWNEVWESNFQPVVVNGFCAIRASFHKPISSVEHEIIITPKMSFGTGHHATTYMMVEQMQSIDFNGKSVFDFGTGTGILAILAEKMKAYSVSAIDIDNWSIENARENIDANSCSKISVTQSAELPNEMFDVVLANINRNVILDYLPQLQDNINDKGLLLLSGLLVSDEDDIVESYSIHKLKLFKRTERNNWISLLLIKE